MTKITTDAEAKAVERLAERLRYWEKRKWNEDVSLVHIAKDLLSHISDARLASTSPAPDGAKWVLVPMVPTRAMAEAGWQTGALIGGDTRVIRDMTAAYAAMLAAAPQPEAK